MKLREILSQTEDIGELIRIWGSVPELRSGHFALHIKDRKRTVPLQNLEPVVLDSVAKDGKVGSPIGMHAAQVFASKLCQLFEKEFGHRVICVMQFRARGRQRYTHIVHHMKDSGNTIIFSKSSGKCWISDNPYTKSTVALNLYAAQAGEVLSLYNGEIVRESHLNGVEICFNGNRLENVASDGESRVFVTDYPSFVTGESRLYLDERETRTLRLTENDDETVKAVVSHKHGEITKKMAQALSASRRFSWVLTGPATAAAEPPPPLPPVDMTTVTATLQDAESLGDAFTAEYLRVHDPRRRGPRITGRNQWEEVFVLDEPSF